MHNFHFSFCNSISFQVFKNRFVSLCLFSSYFLIWSTFSVLRLLDAFMLFYQLSPSLKRFWHAAWRIVMVCVAAGDTIHLILVMFFKPYLYPKPLIAKGEWYHYQWPEAVATVPDIESVVFSSTLFWWVKPRALHYRIEGSAHVWHLTEWYQVNTCTAWFGPAEWAERSRKRTTHTQTVALQICDECVPWHIAAHDCKWGFTQLACHSITVKIIEISLFISSAFHIDIYDTDSEYTRCFVWLSDSFDFHFSSSNLFDGARCLVFQLLRSRARRWSPLLQKFPVQYMVFRDHFLKAYTHLRPCCNRMEYLLLPNNENFEKSESWDLSD